MSGLHIRHLPSCLRTGSSAQPGVTRLCPIIPKKCHPPFLHLSLPETESSSPTNPPPLLSKFLLAWSSDVVPHPPISTPAQATSPLPHIMYPLHRPWILAEGPPTLIPFPASCWCITKDVCSLPPGTPYPPPPFSKYPPPPPPSFEPSPQSSAAGKTILPPQTFAASLPSPPRFYIQRVTPPGPPRGVGMV